MHWRAVDKWIYPGIGLWAADRLFRILRLVILNKLWTVIPSPTAANLPSTATLTLLTPSTLKISFQTPSPHLSWSAGQHFYVVMPGMARLPWEAHPFTASTIPKHPGSGTESGELTFIVRVRDGFTKRMKKQVDKERKAQGLGVDEECKIEVKAAVEGPYGHVRKMDMYDGVLVVAGNSTLVHSSTKADNQVDPVCRSQSPTSSRSFGMPKKANHIHATLALSGWSSRGVRITFLLERTRLTTSPLELDRPYPVGACPRHSIHTTRRPPHPRHSAVHPPPIRITSIRHFCPASRPKRRR